MFIELGVKFLMRIKNSNSENAPECPQDKLKFLSFIDDLQSTRALNPITPERKNKEWVMDAWEDHTQCLLSSPQKSKYIDRMIENHQNKTLRLKKVEFMSEKVEPSLKAFTPTRVPKAQSPSAIQKQNESQQQKARKQKPRQFLISKPTRKSIGVGQEQAGPFKVPVSSVVYPVIRQTQGQGLDRSHRRLERFHSFVARNIRR